MWSYAKWQICMSTFISQPQQGVGQSTMQKVILPGQNIQTTSFINTQPLDPSRTTIGGMDRISIGGGPLNISSNQGGLNQQQLNQVQGQGLGQQQGQLLGQQQGQVLGQQQGQVLGQQQGQVLGQQQGQLLGQQQGQGFGQQQISNSLPVQSQGLDQQTINRVNSLPNQGQGLGNQQAFNQGLNPQQQINQSLPNLNQQGIGQGWFNQGVPMVSTQPFYQQYQQPMFQQYRPPQFPMSQPYQQPYSQQQVFQPQQQTYQQPNSQQGINPFGPTSTVKPNLVSKVEQDVVQDINKGKVTDKESTTQTVLNPSTGVEQTTQQTQQSTYRS